MIRPPRPGDQNYVASTWVRSWSGVGRRHLGMRGRELANHIDVVLERDDTRCLVACSDTDDNAIMGWIVYVFGLKVPVVHYVYCKGVNRQRGIARALLERAGCKPQRALIYTCKGPMTEQLVTAYPGATYMPLEEFLK